MGSGRAHVRVAQCPGRSSQDLPRLVRVAGPDRVRGLPRGAGPRRPGAGRARGASTTWLVWAERGSRRRQVREHRTFASVSLPLIVASLRSAIAESDAVVFCTPEYAGTLPGSFKNLLDWTVGGSEIYGKPATWINVAGAGRGEGADATLRIVLGYVRAAILESSGIRVPVARDAVGPDGLISDEATRGRLADALATILAEVPPVAP
ncbi:MAG TPA: NAD(P)H-dependent oxidoreductase [Thermoleophilaceae bacterium]